MTTINLQCNSPSQIHSSVFQTDNSMTGRAYMKEVLIQIWLKSMKKMSELLDKQVNAQKEFEKTSGVHTSSCKPVKKVCDENERKKKTTAV